MILLYVTIVIFLPCIIALELSQVYSKIEFLENYYAPTEFLNAGYMKTELSQVFIEKLRASVRRKSFKIGGIGSSVMAGKYKNYIRTI